MQQSSGVGELTRHHKEETCTGGETGISGAKRAHPIGAMEVLLELTPFHLVAKKVARETYENRRRRGGERELDLPER